MDSAVRMWGIGSGSAMVGLHDVEERKRGVKKRRRDFAIESANALSCSGGMVVYFGKDRLAKMERGMAGEILGGVMWCESRESFRSLPSCHVLSVHHVKECIFQVLLTFCL